MNKLEQEKILITKRLQEINALLNPDIEKIAKKVEEFTGINVKGIGKKCSMEAKLAKQLFYRTCFLNRISGTLSSNYTASKSRFAAIMARKLHVNKCKKEKSVQMEWERFKIHMKNGK